MVVDRPPLCLDDSDGTSLVVQWFRLLLPVQGMRVESLVEELRSCRLCGVAKKILKKKKVKA